MTNDIRRKEEIAEEISEAISSIDAVQQQIPDGHALHVEIYHRKDPKELLPSAIIFSIKPLDDIPKGARQV